MKKVIIGKDVYMDNEQKYFQDILAKLCALYFDIKFNGYDEKYPVKFRDINKEGRRRLFNGNYTTNLDGSPSLYVDGIFDNIDAAYEYISNWVCADASGNSDELQEIIKYADLATQKVINPLDGTNSTVSDVNDLKAFFDYLICKLKEYIDYKNQVMAQQSQPQSQGCFVNIADAIQAKEIAEQEMLVLKAELEETKKRITELEAQLNQNN